MPELVDRHRGREDEIDQINVNFLRNQISLLNTCHVFLVNGPEDQADFRGRELYAGLNVGRLTRLESHGWGLLQHAVLALSRKLHGYVLQLLGRSVDDHHFEGNVVFVDVDVGLGVDGVGVACELVQSAQFCNIVFALTDGLHWNVVDFFLR